MQYVVEDAISRRGIKVCLIEAQNLKLSESLSRLQVLKKVMGQHILKREAEYKKINDIWRGYERIYRAIHPTYDCFIPPSKYHIFHFLRKRKLGTINSLVDICNYISMSSLLSVVAHNQYHIEGDFRIGLTGGHEAFFPVGLNCQNYIGPGEYAHMDEYHVLCRLDVRPAQKTWITLETRNALIAIHGNRATPDQYVLAAAQQTMDLIEEFCGGSCRLISEKNLLTLS
jgi:DNA/RNA-binding domain of Phe-tRNA-synthetase-like protein